MSECCTGGIKLIYACSGCADVGQIADMAARELQKDGYGNMVCLAGVGAHLSGFVQSALGADENIVIDGCPVGCGKKILEHVDAPVKSFILTEMGLEKSKTEVSEKTVSEIAEKIKTDSLSAAPEVETEEGACDCGGIC